MTSFQASLRYWLCAGGKARTAKKKGVHLEEPGSPSPPLSRPAATVDRHAAILHDLIHPPRHPPPASAKSSSARDKPSATVSRTSATASETSTTTTERTSSTTAQTVTAAKRSPASVQTPLPAKTTCPTSSTTDNTPATASRTSTTPSQTPTTARKTSATLSQSPTTARKTSSQTSATASKTSTTPSQSLTTARKTSTTPSQTSNITEKSFSSTKPSTRADSASFTTEKTLTTINNNTATTASETYTVDSETSNSSSRASRTTTTTTSEESTITATTTTTDVASTNATRPSTIGPRTYFTVPAKFRSEASKWAKTTNTSIIAANASLRPVSGRAMTAGRTTAAASSSDPASRAGQRLRDTGADVRDGMAGEAGLETEMEKCRVSSSARVFSSGARHSASSSSSSSISSSRVRSWREASPFRTQSLDHDDDRSYATTSDGASSPSGDKVPLSRGSSTTLSTLSSSGTAPDSPAGEDKEPARVVHKSATTSVITCTRHHHVTFHCDSVSDSDDGSSGEAEGEGEKKDAKKEKEKDGRRRRFAERKEMSQSINRSKSAGSAKDIPAHALFLRYHLHQPHVDTLEDRLKGLDNEDGWKHIADDTDHLSRPIHKTSSADAAMLALDEELSHVTGHNKGKKSLAKTMKRKLQFLRRRHTDSTLSKVVREEGHLPGKVTPDLAQHWSRSLEDLLLDKTGVELFRGFLRREFSEENLEFWIAVQEFKLVKPSKLPALAQQIYTDYVEAQAPKEINVDSKTRVRTLANLDTPSKAVFDEAQRKVQALMEKDSYPRFLQSDVYQSLVRGQKS